MQPTIERIVEGWAKFVVGARFVLAVIFLPIMVFGFFVFPEARIITAIAIVVLTIVALRRGRLWEKPLAGVGGQEASDNVIGVGFSYLRNSGITSLWRIGLAIVCVQIVGAAVAWWLDPSRAPLILLIGGASSSVVGLVVGLMWDLRSESAWDKFPQSLRRLFSACAVLLTGVGVTLAFATG